MSPVYVVVTVLASIWVGYSAAAVFLGASWVVEALTDYGVPRRWWPLLASAKAAGSAGLLVGLFVPVVGAAAEIGLLLYFGGAVATVLRARYYSHVPFPLLYLAPVLVSAALRLAR